MNRREKIIVALFLLLGVLPGCNREPEGKGPQFGKDPSSPGVPVYRLGVHPLHNPAETITSAPRSLPS
jgi:hypothetical protein